MTGGEHGDAGGEQQEGEGETVTAVVEGGGSGTVVTGILGEAVDESVVVVRLEVANELRGSGDGMVGASGEPAE